MKCGGVLLRCCRGADKCCSVAGPRVHGQHGDAALADCGMGSG